MTETKHDEADEGTSALDTKIAGYAKIAMPLVIVTLAVAVGSVLGVPSAVLILAGGALLAVIMVFWASIRTLFGEVPLAGADAYALGAPRAEEEQKRAVLRALKDLEFERSVGKISDEDYQQLVTKYRTEAKRLLRFLDTDAAPRRAEVEALVQKRLRKAGLAGDDEPSTGAKAKESKEPTAEVDTEEKLAEQKPAEENPGRSGKKKKARAAAKAETLADDAATDDAVRERRCAACDTTNDSDAIFCKKCGARRDGTGADSPKEDAVAEERG